MSTITSRKVTTTTYEYVVPCNGDRNSTPHNEIALALTLADQAFQEAHGRTPYDDEILVRPGDDEIVFYFELSKETRH